MNIPVSEKKIEAIYRMKKLGIYDPIIEQFEKENIVAESAPPIGACFWLDEEQLAQVRDFEETNNALVYHVIHSYTEFGELENYLFVSDYREEWEKDRDDIDYNIVFVYVENKSIPEFSEFGSIGFVKTPAAGLLRIY